VHYERKHPFTPSRSDQGIHLIELLTALFMAGMLAVVLSSSLSEVIRLCTASDRIVLATTAAQEVIERIRSTPFEDLPSSGTYDVQVNLGGSTDARVSPTGEFIAQRPTMLDGTKLTWMASASSGELPKNRFQGTLTVSITDMDLAEAKRVIVEANWKDSTTLSMRRYQVGTVVAKNGIVRHK
jgi:hypothetical protein